VRLAAAEFKVQELDDDLARAKEMVVAEESTIEAALIETEGLIPRISQLGVDAAEVEEAIFEETVIEESDPIYESIVDEVEPVEEAVVEEAATTKEAIVDEVAPVGEAVVEEDIAEAEEATVKEAVIDEVSEGDVAEDAEAIVEEAFVEAKEAIVEVDLPVGDVVDEEVAQEDIVSHLDAGHGIRGALSLSESPFVANYDTFMFGNTSTMFSTMEVEATPDIVIWNEEELQAAIKEVQDRPDNLDVAELEPVEVKEYDLVRDFMVEK
jgi:hypothetical protein